MYSSVTTWDEYWSLKPTVARHEKCSIQNNFTFIYYKRHWIKVTKLFWMFIEDNLLGHWLRLHKPDTLIRNLWMQRRWRSYEAILQCLAIIIHHVTWYSSAECRLSGRRQISISRHLDTGAMLFADSQFLLSRSEDDVQRWVYNLINMVAKFSMEANTEEGLNNDFWKNGAN